jgi:uncharacterized phage-associated protein
MAYEVQAVANNFLDLAKRDGELLDPMKIQKLVYLAHGWSLALNGSALIKQEVEAWPYGPVIRTLYDEFKKYRASPIAEKAHVLEDATPLDENAKRLIEAVWSKYRPYSAIQLSMFTHEPGYAWDLTIKDRGPYSTIPNEMIRDEFVRRRQRK